MNALEWVLHSLLQLLDSVLSSHEILHFGQQLSVCVDGNCEVGFSVGNLTLQ